MSSSDDSDVCDFDTNFGDAMNRKMAKNKGGLNIVLEPDISLFMPDEDIELSPKNSQDVSTINTENIEVDDVEEPLNNQVQEMDDIRRAMECISRTVVIPTTSSRRANKKRAVKELGVSTVRNTRKRAGRKVTAPDVGVIGTRRSTRNKEIIDDIDISSDDDDLMTLITPLINMESNNVIANNEVVCVEDGDAEQLNLTESEIAQKLDELDNLADDIANGRKRKKPAPPKREQPKRQKKNILLDFLASYAMSTIPTIPSPPVPQVNVVNSSNKVVNDVVILDDDSDDDYNIPPIISDEVIVKVEWQCTTTKVFYVKKFESLDCIIKHYCDEKKVEPTSLLFTLNNKEVDLSKHCYISLNLKEDSIIEGNLIDLQNKSGILEPLLENQFKLKIQCPNYKNDFFIYLENGQTNMGVALWQLMQHFKVEIDKVKASVDGYAIKATDTPDSLDLEDGDCIDVTII